MNSKKILSLMLTALAVGISMFTATSCDDGETYADQKKKERRAISRFLENNPFGGAISVISEQQFFAQDTTTDLSKNQYVLFNDDGIYMQIIRRGEGKSMIEMSKEMPDSTVSKVLLCRFLEYDIENADTTLTNLASTPVVDKMLCKYTRFSKSYSASFTEGNMLSYYGQSVPEGWLKPLDFLRLTRDTEKVAKVRLIVPHSSGTSNASGYVLPYFYEISYELGR